ncbi:hypothetical protein [Nonomuraea basaltis]|uniref:hypothetical protein n=1 Tax=Nonomuraea basaltis TaxID=2495887 RepID=UPI00110C64A4|nr:hypothetical protein [Nonomuraea basaltis]TMR97525.1 hypothetical protein EJK15_17545 [Nonomuraea basaltis]
MAHEWTVTGVEETTGDDGRTPYWVIVYEVPVEVAPDGQWRYYVPKEAVEYRAAEYGLTDVDEVLDVLVHEPLLIELQSAGVLPPLTPSLTDAAAARELVRQQIAACRERHGAVAAQRKHSNARAVDPLQAIRDACRIDPIRTAELRMEIDRHRMAQARGEGRK